MQKLSSCISVLVHITTTRCHSSTAGFCPCCYSLSGFHTGLTTHRARLLTTRGKEDEKIPSPEREGVPASAAAPAVSAAAAPATDRHMLH